MSIITTTTSIPIDTTSCTIQKTTDEQLNLNLSDMVKLLVTALQDGTIPVKNTDRLQNLTVNDLITLVKDSIDIPNIYTSIITNENNELTNVTNIITERQTNRDSKFVSSDYIQFKVVQKSNPNMEKYGTELNIPYLVLHLPADLLNKDRILALYLTTKNDSNINLLANDVIFDYDIEVDPNDAYSRYLVQIPAPKIDVGGVIEYDITNLPSTPENWGIYGIEKFIKVTHLVDEYWTPSETSNLTAEGEFDIAKRVITNTPIPMMYGLNDTLTENIDIINDYIKIINLSNNEILSKEKDFSIGAEPKWIILPKDSDIDFSKSSDKVTNFIKDTNKVILQLETESIKNIIDNLLEFNTIHTLYESTASELSNVFVMPPNKIIAQLLNEKVTIPEYINKSLDNYKIIEQMVSSLIEKKVSTQLEGALKGATTTNSLLLKMISNEDEYTYIQKFYIPDRVIEEIINEIIEWKISTINSYENYAVILFKDLLPFTLYFASFLNTPDRIINIIEKTIISYREIALCFVEETNIIEQDPNTISTAFEHNQYPIYSETNKKLLQNFINYSISIIEQISDIKNELQKHFNISKIATKIIQQYPNTSTIVAADNKYDFYISETSNSTKEYLSYGNVMLNEMVNIINPLAYFPILMSVSSGSTNYLQDIRNMKLVSTLAMNTEYIPMYTAEGQQQRSTYELIAEQDQKVFDINTNPYDTTVYREGFRLSRGDYYTNGSKIILKAAANKGEIITIVSERKYTYSNNVSKEELENVITTMKAIKPILSYPASTYELAVIPIIIENFNSMNTYDITVKFDGKYRDDIAFIRNKDTIYIDIPEVIDIKRQIIQITVQVYEVGKLQSAPVTAEINVRNLYDYNKDGDIKRLVIGTAPIEWYGKLTESMYMDESMTESSTYEILPETPTLLERIKITKDNYIQSNLIDNPKFTGTFYDAYLGLENLDSRRIPIISTNLSETILNIGSVSFTQTDIEEAFENSRLWFIIDASTDDSLNKEFLNAVNGVQIGSTQKYAYRRADELMGHINLLPGSATTLYMEHIDKLKNRLIRDIIIFDVELKVDFDFEDFAVISENGLITKKDFTMESIEYQVQENVPHLLIKINDPEIPTANNPYLNISSNILLPMNNASLNSKQLLLPDKGFAVNNIYNEVIFSGLKVNHTAVDDNLVIPLLKDCKKFDMGINYRNTFKNDFFVLTEEVTGLTDTTGLSDKKEIYLGMVRFKLDEESIKENVKPQTRLKLLPKFLTRKLSVKCLANTNLSSQTLNSSYISDFAIIEYGGYNTYTDNDNIKHTVIDSCVSYRKVYIKDNFDIKNGLVLNSNNIYDGYHVSYGNYTEIRLPNFWDVVYRSTLRTTKSDELRYVWELIRDNVSITDQRWLNLTDGLLSQGNYEKDTIDFIGKEKIRDLEVINMENSPGFLIFGGIGYKPIQTKSFSTRVTSRYITDLAKTETIIAPKLLTAYNKRYIERYKQEQRTVNGIKERYTVDTGGWFHRTDIIDIVYGWELDEPYVEFHWAKTFTERLSNGNSHEVMNYYVNRISRSKKINTDIYYIDTSFIDDGFVSNDEAFSQVSSIYKKLVNTDYQKLYTDSNVSANLITNINYNNRTSFQDIVYNSGIWWLTLKEIGSIGTSLYKLKFTNNLNVSSGLTFTKCGDLDSVVSKWSLSKDITSNLRGDGPILIRHVSNPEYTINSNSGEIKGGIYNWDTWNNNLLHQVDVILPASALIFGIPEIMGVRNPYFLAIDYLTNLNIRIDLTGIRIFLIIYLDKYISLLTSEEFNLFKEEILHTEKLISEANPNKILQILPNDEIIPIRSILPNGDDYRASGAQVSFNRTETQTGREGTNLVFRVTNPLEIPLELDSIRFTTK